MSSSSIYRRCRPGGPWRRLIPGVVQLHSGRPTRLELAKAALIHSGPGVLTGVDAARRHGVRRLPDDRRIHVLVPHDRRVASRDFVVVERTIHLPDPVIHDGLPLASPARAIVDAARRLTRLDEVQAMVADAVQRGICSTRELAAELAAGSTIGSALPRRVLAEVSDGIRSAAEGWARSLVRRTSLPAPEWNVAIRDAAGVLLGVADAYWRDAGLVWEIDSKEFHLSPTDYARTLTKHAVLTSSGLVVLHTIPSRLRTEPLRVIRELEGAYRFAKTSPAPAVEASLWRPAA